MGRIPHCLLVEGVGEEVDTGTGRLSRSSGCQAEFHWWESTEGEDILPCSLSSSSHCPSRFQPVVDMAVDTNRRPLWSWFHYPSSCRSGCLLEVDSVAGVGSPCVLSAVPVPHFRRSAAAVDMGRSRDARLSGWCHYQSSFQVMVEGEEVVMCCCPS